MIVYFLLWALYMTRINCFILRDSYNHQFENSAHFKIDETIKKKDLEIIDKQQLQQFSSDDKKKAFYNLNLLASKEYRKSSKIPSYWYKRSNIFILTTEAKAIAFKGTAKTEKPYKETMHRTKVKAHRKNRRVKIKTTAYDYDKKLREYYEELLYEEQKNDTYHPKAVEQDLIYYLKRAMSPDKGSNRSIIINRLSDLRQMFIDFRQKYPKEELWAKTWKILNILGLVYLTVAVPLWCIKGWCCCCLCCDIFKPRRIIKRAKDYLEQHPPGIQKTRTGHVLYKPTQQERRAYLEFEHLIKII